jgi:putative NIF3 family GTP cyclohydrolase 1 type 2
MKASELIKELCEGAFAPEITCDTIKAGDAQREINKVGVTMFATVDVVRRAKEMGVDMLIVHEPTYYDHMDTDIPKQRLLWLKNS